MENPARWVALIVLMVPVCLTATAEEGKLEEQLARSNESFAFELYAQVLQQNAGENVFISPASIAMALAMATNGAEGATRQCMMETLCLGTLPLEGANKAYQAFLRESKQADPRVTLAIANSLWVHEAYTFKPAFLECNRTRYGAEATSLDFNSARASKTINAWVEEQTRGKIKKIVPSRLSPELILFLINAVYFKAEWSVTFDEEKTKRRTFHLVRGRTRKHPLMFQDGEFGHMQSDTFQAIRIPYGENGRVAMYVFLPAKASSLAAFCGELNAGSWAGWMEQFYHRECELYLPKFTMEFEITLNDALSALGMGEAFDRERANFSAMVTGSGGNVYIDEVKHKTFVEVNEEGTEAAAVTSVGFGVTSVAPEPVVFMVDRPFFCAIRDDTTKAILFMGSIVNP